jgi:hypothetical protein
MTRFGVLLGLRWRRPFGTFRFMNELPSSHHDVIKLLGGPVSLAEGLGFKRSRTEKWSKTNSIPRWHWKTVEGYAKAKGRIDITEDLLDTLCSVKAKQRVAAKEYAAA